jgi:hypothetical protein
MDTKHTKPGPWYADEQEPGPTPGSTDPKTGPGRGGEVQPESAVVDEDNGETDPGPKSGRTGDVRPPSER